MRKPRRRLWAVLLAALVAGIAIGGAARAALTDDVKTFTGCLSTGDGVIVKVKEGESPKSPCSSGQTLARLSGGDITSIGARTGGGLTGGGTGGAVELSLRRDCSEGQVLKWISGAWECASDTSFNGHFTSPNGKFSLDLTDDGIVLKGPANSVTVSNDRTTIDGFTYYPSTAFQWNVGDERHFGTERHEGTEYHEGFEQHTGSIQNWGFESHRGNEQHGGFDVSFNGVHLHLYAGCNDPLTPSLLRLADGATTNGVDSCR